MHIRYLRGSLCALVVIGSLANAMGCGGVNRGGPADAAADASPSPDSAPPDAAPVPRCDPTKPFGAPTLVAGINSTVRDQGAELIDDLTIIFGSDRDSATGGLYVATRSSPASPFGTPAALTAINATPGATGPTLTSDGLTMYYALTTAQDTGDIYVTHRASKADAFGPGTQVMGLNSNVQDLDPFVTADGSALYFDSARGGGLLDLYVAVRQADGSFGTSQVLANLNTSATDGHPVLSHDGLTIYWSSNRTDVGTQGGTDIWMATRPTAAGPFVVPMLVPQLNSPKNESLSWISPDGCMVLLQSDRDGGVGLQDIYQAVKPM
jgi:Tol biopolymer transport system component